MISPTIKELILINPRSSFFLLNYLQWIFVRRPVPSALLTLAALTPKDYRVKIVNQRQFWRSRDFVPGRLVGITCMTAAVTEAYQLARKFRQAGSRVILGGPHVTALPDEALQHADSVVIGEAESVWGQAVKDFEEGRLQKVYEGKALEDFFSPVYEYYRQLDPRILSRSGLNIDRGCRYHCDFCARISQWLRFIKLEQVLELVKRIKAGSNRFLVRRPEVVFRCDNIYSDPSYAKELFRQMAPLGISWGGNVSIDIGFDEEALQLAQQSGCRGLLIGFETIRPQDYRKTSPGPVRSPEDYKTAIRNIKRHGIEVIGTFIIGLDGYRPRDYLRLLGFLISSGLRRTSMSILTPFPGSALYDRLQKEGRILSFDWRKYDFFFCVIRPKNGSVASVYAWYWFIRLVSILFMPYFYQVFFCLFLGWTVAYYLSYGIIHGF